MDAYYQTTGNTLYTQYYSDNDEVDRYLKSAHYTENPICFAIGWNKYSPDTKEYDIDIRIDS